ncbi:MAG TPA: NUDIX domain-containing protein, partial [Sphingomicrobium sp.]|nr:NUDIX domain-containing protein [Sphingomicrobium sp.]
MSDDAIPAATLIVVRDRADGPPDLLMVERAEGMAFAAGALVFPGGRIDESDRQLSARIGVEPAAIAAIRETIEETAVPVGLAPMPEERVAVEIQQSLIVDEPFAQLLDRCGSRIDTEALTPFA